MTTPATPRATTPATPRATTAATARGSREVAALGEAAALGPLRLVGVAVHAAGTPEKVREAWPRLQGSGLVVLTTAAAEALGEARLASGAPLSVVVPS
jgi:vacuolar-type H+-ATPase subunit F/Vma7